MISPIYKVLMVLTFITLLAVTHNVTLGLFGVAPMGPYHNNQAEVE
jgi:hypothetical protein